MSKELAEYGIYEHKRKKPYICDACGEEINKGDLYQEADAGERYCMDCVL